MDFVPAVIAFQVLHKTTGDLYVVAYLGDFHIFGTVLANLFGIGLLDGIKTNDLKHQATLLRIDIALVDESALPCVDLHLDMEIAICFFLHRFYDPCHGGTSFPNRKPFGFVYMLPKGSVAGLRPGGAGDGDQQKG